jgi:hypothetical protein
MVDWNSLSSDTRELLGKLVEGSSEEPGDENLVTLVECGLIARRADRWEPTPVGLSVYVVRDLHLRSRNDT